MTSPQPGANANGRAGCEAVLAGSGALRVGGVEQRRVRTVRGAQGEDGRGGGLSDVDARASWPAVRDRGERRRVVGLDARDARVDARRREGSGSWPRSVTSTSRAAAATAASGEAPRFDLGVERVRTGAPVDGIQGVVDGHVHHGVQPRFVQRVVAGRDARRERGLAGIRVPGDDRIGSDRPVGVGRGDDRRESRRRDGSREERACQRARHRATRMRSRDTNAKAPRREHEHRAGAAGADRGGAPVEALVDGAHDRRIGWLRPGGGAGLGVEGLGNRRGRGERPGGEARHDQAGKSVRVVSGHAAQACSAAGRRPVDVRFTSLTDRE